MFYNLKVTKEKREGEYGCVCVCLFACVFMCVCACVCACVYEALLHPLLHTWAYETIFMKCEVKHSQGITNRKLALTFMFKCLKILPQVNEVLF